MSNGKDSTRSWVVAVGTFLLLFLETGIVKSLGVLLPSIREQFATKTWVVGFAIALVPGFGSVICLLSGAVTKVWSPRVSIAVCALLSALGLLGSCMASNVYVLMVTLVLTGFYTGTTSVTMGALSKYFDKYYNIAVTSAQCGTSCGMIVMPVLAQYFLDLYGWRGTILLLAVISLNAVACGLVFKPPAGDRKYYLLSSSIETTNTSSNCYTNIVYSLDMHLFNNIDYIALIAMSAGFGYSFTGWIIYIIPHALDVGFSPYQASAVATAGGMGRLFGNCAYPILYKLMSAKAQIYIGMLSLSTAAVLDTVASSYSSYSGMVLSSILFGFARGVASTAWFKEMKDVVNDDTKMINAIGWGLMIHGVVSVITGLVSGWLFDVYGSFSPSFLLLGAVSAASLIPQCILDVVQLRRSIMT